MAPPRNILVGYDGSDSACRALDRAADLAGYGSILTVVGGTKALAQARDRLLSRQVSALYVAPAGEPVETLIAKACALEADLLVVGRSGSNGSPIGTILRDAPCDVLVVC